MACGLRTGRSAARRGVMGLDAGLMRVACRFPFAPEEIIPLCTALEPFLEPFWSPSGALPRALLWSFLELLWSPSGALLEPIPEQAPHSTSTKQTINMWTCWRRVAMLQTFFFCFLKEFCGRLWKLVCVCSARKEGNPEFQFQHEIKYCPIFTQLLYRLKGLPRLEYYGSAL